MKIVKSMHLPYVLLLLMLTNVSFAQLGALKNKLKKKEEKNTTTEPVKKNEEVTPVSSTSATPVAETKKADTPAKEKQIEWPEGNVYRVKTAPYTLPLHEKYMGKVIFSSQKLTRDGTKEEILKSAFTVGDPIFGRVFTKTSVKNYCTYQDGSGPYDNNYYIATAMVFFDGATEGIIMDKFNHKSSPDWNTWQMFPYATGEDAEFNSEYFINAVNKLSPGMHSVKIEIYAGETGRYSLVPIATGEFKLNKPAGVSLKLGKSWATYKAKMTNPALEKQLVDVMKTKAKKDGWNEEFSKAKITDQDWYIEKNTYTGEKLYRTINAVLYAKWPDGHCTVQEFTFKQAWTGTAFSNATEYFGTGNQEKIDCE